MQNFIVSIFDTVTIIQLKLKSDVNKGFVEHVKRYLGIGDFSYKKVLIFMMVRINFFLKEYKIVKFFKITSL